MIKHSIERNVLSLAEIQVFVQTGKKIVHCFAYPRAQGDKFFMMGTCKDYEDRLKNTATHVYVALCLFLHSSTPACYFFFHWRDSTAECDLPGAQASTWGPLLWDLGLEGLYCSISSSLTKCSILILTNEKPDLLYWPITEWSEKTDRQRIKI